ncbi:MAG: peptidylprolyl isomerase [Bacteroidetes bacterium]|nr:MAG: peptidylprolyl isomerase [Bacteroidota bacterium]
MKIAEKKVVGINYTLRNDAGETLDSSEGRDALYYIHGVGQLISGLEEALEGKTAGDKLNVSIPPEKGYGERQEALIQKVPRTQFPQDVDIQKGMQFHAQGGGGQPLVVTVVDLGLEDVTIDGNHALAGVNLNFEVEVTEVREATASELDHGHVHGPGGHQH